MGKCKSVVKIKRQAGERPLLISLLVLLPLLVTACGGKEPVPNVTGDFLDVARSDLEEAGYEVEVVGGGSFGVMEESQ